VRLYFRFIHDQHHSLFHEPSVHKQLQDGAFPNVLLYPMLALGSRFSDSPELAHIDPRQRGQSLAKKAAGMLNMHDISVTTIQASILLGTIAYAESGMESEALYYSIAVRLALLLDLPNHPTNDEIERQLNLRIWWTIYMIDIWSSTGLRLPRQFGYSANVPLPIEEVGFIELPAVPRSPSVASIWGEMAHLAHIWAEIHELNKASVAGEGTPEILNSSVATLSAKLLDWAALLPQHLICTRQNLTRYASFGFGSAFAALHLGFHYYNVVLFYQFLSPAARHPSISTAHFSNSCKEHARKFCDLLYLCHTLEGCAPLYVMVGHMLVVTSTVYMHSLLFSSSEDEISTARARLERNFEILTRLQSYWVELDVSLGRLKAFHNACRISSEQSFRMDRWMLTFLLEHGTPVAEKFVIQESPQVGSDPNSASFGEQPTPAEVTQGTLQALSASTGSPILTLQDWYHQTFV
jgi:hypothetical protein